MSQLSTTMKTADLFVPSGVVSGYINNRSVLSVILVTTAYPAQSRKRRFGAPI